MQNTKKILVLDTETVGNIAHPIVYDVGFIVTDRNGVIYHAEHHVVKEIFADVQLMATAYYAHKYNTYIDGLYERNVEPLYFGEILSRIDEVIELYNIKTLAAYNLLFDERAMANTCELFFDNKNWLKYPLERLCILCGACDILYGKKYIEFVRANHFETEKGNIKTSAEIGYRFLTNNLDFEEAHKGLDDCFIEAEILKALYAKHKKFNATPRAFPMREVYKREKELLAKT